MSTNYFNQKNTTSGKELPYRVMTVQALQNAIAQKCIDGAAMGGEKVRQMMLRIDLISNRLTSLARTKGNNC